MLEEEGAIRASKKMSFEDEKTTENTVIFQQSSENSEPGAVLPCLIVNPPPPAPTSAPREQAAVRDSPESRGAVTSEELEMTPPVCNSQENGQNKGFSESGKNETASDASAKEKVSDRGFGEGPECVCSMKGDPPGLWICIAARMLMRRSSYGAHRKYCTSRREMWKATTWGGSDRHRRPRACSDVKAVELRGHFALIFQGFPA